jgi:hypothetical protein
MERVKIHLNGNVFHSKHNSHRCAWAMRYCISHGRSPFHMLYGMRRSGPFHYCSPHQSMQIPELTCTTCYVCANDTLYFTHALTSNVSSTCTILHKNATNFKEQSPSWEADSSPDGQEILCHLKTPKILCQVHKSPSLT